jgi:hypothetical protein
MSIDTVCIDRIATCPTCTKPMRFARSFPNFGANQPLQILECIPCRLAVAVEEMLDFLENGAA